MDKDKLIKLLRLIYECGYDDGIGDAKYGSPIYDFKDHLTENNSLIKELCDGDQPNKSTDKALILYNVTHRNILMTDMNGVKIKPGHKIVYQKGELHEATCDVVKKNDGVYLTNWSDNNETISVADFWHEPTDHKITEVLNPNYGG